MRFLWIHIQRRRTRNTLWAIYSYHNNFWQFIPMWKNCYKFSKWWRTRSWSDSEFIDSLSTFIHLKLEWYTRPRLWASLLQNNIIINSNRMKDHVINHVWLRVRITWFHNLKKGFFFSLFLTKMIMRLQFLNHLLVVFLSSASQMRLFDWRRWRGAKRTRSQIFQNPSIANTIWTKKNIYRVILITWLLLLTRWECNIRDWVILSFTLFDTLLHDDIDEKYKKKRHRKVCEIPSRNFFFLISP